MDLTIGETAYRHVNGIVRDMAFLSGTVDYYVRGYDLATGHEIWRARLPAGGQSTPATYIGRDGRQYLVVAAGGHGYVGTKLGDAVIAYALPDK